MMCFWTLLISGCSLITHLQKQLAHNHLFRVALLLLGQLWLQLWQPSKLHTRGSSLACSTSGIFERVISCWVIRYPRRTGHHSEHASSVATGMCLLLPWQQTLKVCSQDAGCDTSVAPVIPDFLTHTKQKYKYTQIITVHNHLSVMLVIVSQRFMGCQHPTGCNKET